MKEFIENKYKNILVNMKQSEDHNKVKDITLNMILGEETYEFYYEYFKDINYIIENRINKNNSDKVKFRIYYDYAFEVLISFFRDINDRNKVILENYFNAISILIRNDDINKIIESTILIMYDQYYKN